MQRTLHIRIAGAILAAAAALSLLPAQEQTAVIRGQVNLVNVLFSAFDRKGQHIRGLSRSDLDIYEDGVKQNIEYFRFEGENEADSLTVVLHMDTSASVKDKLAMEQSIASDFLKEILRPTKDLAAVMEFGSEVALIQDFTDDQSRLSRALQSLQAGGGTALFDGIYLAAEEKLQSEAGRKVILIVSDGEDTQSKVKQDEAIRVAQRNDVTVFAIGVKSGFGPSDFGALEDVCRETGGRFFDARVERKSITTAFQGMTTALKQQYNISYYSSNQEKDGGFRRIQIRVKKDNVKVQHRSGYYAPRP